MLTGIEIKTINHLGIVAGIIDELQIVDIINQEARNRWARDSQFRRNSHDSRYQMRLTAARGRSSKQL